MLGLLGPAPTVALADERRSSVTGTVWFDSNANGRPDSGERAIRNLQTDLDVPNYHESRKTGDNGINEFTGLSAGNPDVMILNGLTAFVHVDFRIARAERARPIQRPDHRPHLARKPCLPACLAE
jgi:hypothetical protein